MVQKQTNPNPEAALFDPGSTPGLADAVIGENAVHIGEVAAKHPYIDDEPDSTDRWLAETGGGERRKTLAADTPPLPKPYRGKPNRQSRTGGRSMVDGPSGRDIARELSSGGTAPPTEEEAARATAGAALARRALWPIRAEDIHATSAGSLPLEMARLRAADERRHSGQ